MAVTLFVPRQFRFDCLVSSVLLPIRILPSQTGRDSHSRAAQKARISSWKLVHWLGVALAGKASGVHGPETSHDCCALAG